MPEDHIEIQSSGLDVMKAWRTAQKAVKGTPAATKISFYDSFFDITLETKK